jgi:hypothetical protein
LMILQCRDSPVRKYDFQGKFVPKKLDSYR